MEIKSTGRDNWGRPHGFKGKRPGGRKKKKVTMVDRFFTCRMKTSDNWYPSLENLEGDEEEVQITIIGWAHQYKEGEVAYRIGVWGGDDFGLIRDYKYEETTPQKLFELVMSIPEPLTQAWLEERGFYPF